MAVLDASPIIYYGRIGRLRWLREFYGKLVTTPSVVRETVDEAKVLGKPGVSTIEEAFREGVLQVHSLAGEENDLASRVAESERIEIEDAQLIVLTRKLRDILVTNDKKLILVAKAHGVKTHWAVTPVILSVKRGKLNKKEAKDVIGSLVEAGLRIKSETLISIYRIIENI